MKKAILLALALSACSYSHGQIVTQNDLKDGNLIIYRPAKVIGSFDNYNVTVNGITCPLHNGSFLVTIIADQAKVSVTSWNDLSQTTEMMKPGYVRVETRHRSAWENMSWGGGLIGGYISEGQQPNGMYTITQIDPIIAQDWISKHKMRRDCK